MSIPTEAPPPFFPGDEAMFLVAENLATDLDRAALNEVNMVQRPRATSEDQGEVEAV